MLPDNKTFEVSGISYLDNWEFLLIYLQEMDGCFAQLKDAVHNNDTATAREAIHQMLGATSIMNFTELQKSVTEIQKIVKGQTESIDPVPLLSEIGFNLDSLFGYMCSKRPTYKLHLLSSDADFIKVVERLPKEEIKIKSSKSKSVEESTAWLAEHETDMIIYDYEGNRKKFIDFNSELAVSGIETPILLVSEYFGPSTPARDSIFPNLKGRLIKASNKEEWLKAIKTLANGREYT